MQNQPSFDRSLFIPIGVGVFALIGICIILSAGRITALRANVQEVPTATAFKYALVGTEPMTVAATLVISPPPTEEIIVLPTRTIAPAVTASPVLSPSIKTLTRTPTSESSAPLNEGTYDDIYDHIIYGGNWDPQTSVPGAYHNTLHVSNTLGNSVTFRFIGQEIRVFFQAGPSLGTIRLNLDGTNYEMDESNSATQTFEWVLPSVTNGTHTVTITHLSGGSVNLDYFIIPEVPVTPTKTPTTRP